MSEAVILTHTINGLLTLISQTVPALNFALAAERMEAQSSGFGAEAFLMLNDLMNLTLDSESMEDLADNLSSVELFGVDVDVTEFVDDWGTKLFSTVALLEPTAEQQLDAIHLLLAGFSYSEIPGSVSTADVQRMWAVVASTWPIEQQRFLALLLLFAFSEMFAPNTTMFDTYKGAVSVYFGIRDYLVNDGPYPLEAVIDQAEKFGGVVLTEVKSLFTRSMGLIADEVLSKAISAAGNVAQSVEKEDLEGTVVHSGVFSAGLGKKYPRIEKLE